MAKKPARKPPADPAPGESSKARTKTTPKAPAGVTVRMYCHGLGDCFLLTFPSTTANTPVRVLIDCGILQRSPGESPKLRAVAQSLHDDTKGEDGKSFIDLLIVTHEHWDHVAGFSHAKDLFEQITFGKVWLSWAENLRDPESKAIKADLGKKKLALEQALRGPGGRMKAASAVDDPSVLALREDLEASLDVLSFFGPPEASTGLAATKNEKGEGRMSLGATMNWLREKVKPRDFCSPGERRALSGTDGVNVYVLGPPRDPKKLRKMNPTGDQGYKLNIDRASFFGAVDAVSGIGGQDDQDGPFDQRFRVSVEEAALDPFFQHYYGFPGDPLGDPGETWRRIDNEWLAGGLSRLALQLDVGVNNTSLALAFELPDGRTLIFPGDAQIGNWLSWDDVQFKDDADQPLAITAKDLLNRAVFYKVGHHGSHNATRRVGGLEEMKSGDLVVMIPTDEKFAMTQSKPHGWKMPAHGVNEALKRASNHRILRADRDKKELDDAPADAWGDQRDQVKFAKATFGESAGDQDAATRPIWVEYTLPM